MKIRKVLVTAANPRQRMVPSRRGSKAPTPCSPDGWARDGSAAYIETLGAW
ncbi:MAG: hypothetical protein ACREH8_04930 [Opitutaceae bacterium]